MTPVTTKSNKTWEISEKIEGVQSMW